MTQPTRPSTASDLEALLGQTMGPTSWRRISQADIDTFARLTGDLQ